jgi:hypothetical protein
MRKCIFLLLVQTALAESVFPLTVPVARDEAPAAGRRAKVTPPEYAGTEVFYTLYLPENYTPGGNYPVITEYTGNQWKPGNSTGRVADANLGYAPAKALNSIWVVFPYVSGTNSVTTWWGSEEETVEYCLKNLRRICRTYGGNPAEIFICGFSRGAIAVNYLGLYNDSIADVWLGFFSHDHYDGFREWKNTRWGSPLDSYRTQAGVRIQRMAGRSVLISQKDEIATLEEYIRGAGYAACGNFSFVQPDINRIIPGIPSADVSSPHTDKWMLYPSDYAEKGFRWFAEVRQNKPGTFSVSGTVSDSGGRPVPGIIVDSGRTHFAVSGADGRYVIEGLAAGRRTIEISKENSRSEFPPPETVELTENRKNLNFILPAGSTP